MQMSSSHTLSLQVAASPPTNELYQVSTMLMESANQEISSLTTLLEGYVRVGMAPPSPLSPVVHSGDSRLDALVQQASAVDARTRLLRDLVRQLLADATLGQQLELQNSKLSAALSKAQMHNQGLEVQLQQNAVSSSQNELLRAAQQAHRVMQDKVIATRSTLEKEQQRCDHLESQNIQLHAQVRKQVLYVAQLEDGIISQKPSIVQPLAAQPLNQRSSTINVLDAKLGGFVSSEPSESIQTGYSGLRTSKYNEITDGGKPKWLEAASPATSSETLARILHRQEMWLSKADEKISRPKEFQLSSRDASLHS